MGQSDDIHPNAPSGGGGPGNFCSVAPTGQNPSFDQWMTPGPLGMACYMPDEVLKITGVVIAGGPLSKASISAVNKAAERTPLQWRRYLAYNDVIKVGGSLAWRANNPGNLRDAATKIGSVPGAVGHFAVFASMANGRTAQKNLYLSKYGDMKVSDAINKLTPPNENNTVRYLNQLKLAGVELDKDVKSQIDLLMNAVEANEGMIEGIIVSRTP